MSHELVELLRELARRLVKEKGGADSPRVRQQLRIVNTVAKAILVAQYQKREKQLLGADTHKEE